MHIMQALCILSQVMKFAEGNEHTIQTVVGIKHRDYLPSTIQVGSAIFGFGSEPPTKLPPSSAKLPPSIAKLPPPSAKLPPPSAPRRSSSLATLPGYSHLTMSFNESHDASHVVAKCPHDARRRGNPFFDPKAIYLVVSRSIERNC